MPIAWTATRPRARLHGWSTSLRYYYYRLVSAGSTRRDIVPPEPRQRARDRQLRAVRATGAASGPEDQLFADRHAGGREPVGDVRHPPVVTDGEYTLYSIFAYRLIDVAKPAHRTRNNTCYNLYTL